MVRVAIACLALSALGACASGPSAESPQQKILGNWTCETDADGMKVKGDFTYLANGLGEGIANVDVDGGGMAISLVGDVNSTWGFAEDGKLNEKVTSMKVTSAKMSGQDIAAPMIASMIQPMVDEMVVGQTSNTTVVFGDGTMTTTTEDGVVTNCKR